MSYRVTILPRAEFDIERNARWWADHYSTEQAARGFWTIRDQLESLREFPEGCGLSSENDQFPYEIRDKPVGLGSRPRFRAVFTIRNHDVCVLTVRAGEEDRLTPDDVDFKTN